VTRRRYYVTRCVSKAAAAARINQQRSGLKREKRASAHAIFPPARSRHNRWRLDAQA